MNRRWSELLAARRVRDRQDRLEAIVRAYVQPAFSSGRDLAGGGARFTRLRAVMSAEGTRSCARSSRRPFGDTSHAGECDRTTRSLHCRFATGASA
jgi:hypothetical protein